MTPQEGNRGFHDSHVPGESPPDFVLRELQPPPLEKTALETILENRPKINIGQTLAEIKTMIRFEERGERHRIHDVIGMIRHLGHGEQETYDDKLRKEEKKGHDEAAAYGIGNIHGKEFVFYALHWDFFNGSIGVVAGEKFVEASDLAIRRKLPLIGCYSSAGVRQQENFPGLAQMSRMTAAIAEYKRRSNNPYVSVLLGHVWGGVSASVVPLGDFSVAFAGTEYGFSGPNVIRAFEGKAVEPGRQSVEAKALLRNIDIVIDDEKELSKWLDSLLQREKTKDEKLDLAHIVNLPPILELAEHDRFPLGQNKMFSLLSSRKKKEGEEHMIIRESEIQVDDLYERFQALAKDPRRPDTDYLIQQCFTNVVPLYNGISTEKELMYPAIIAALGDIDGQRFLIIGNQPSFQIGSRGITKRSPTPTPQDYRFARRMMQVGNRLRLPLVLFTDTLGAMPTIDAEDDDQGREIAETISATITYRHPVIPIVTGALGSGGGIATTPLGAEKVAFLKNAMAFVAAPPSVVAILDKTDSPSPEAIVRTINSMRATAHDQLDMGLISTVIEDPGGNAWKHPAQTAEVIRRNIAQVYLEREDESTSKRIVKRIKRSKELRGMPFDRSK